MNLSNMKIYAYTEEIIAKWLLKPCLRCTFFSTNVVHLVCHKCEYNRFRLTDEPVQRKQFQIWNLWHHFDENHATSLLLWIPEEVLLDIMELFLLNYSHFIEFAAAAAAASLEPPF